MNRKGRILFFENDEEFTTWALNPNPIIEQTYKTDDRYQSTGTLPNVNLDVMKHKTKGMLVSYYDLTSEYYDEVNKGTLFCIKDPFSDVFERKVIRHGVPVDNLIRYYMSEEKTYLLAGKPE